MNSRPQAWLRQAEKDFATPPSERFDQAETDGAITTGSEVIQVLKRLDQD